jgi:hypothetical protein
MACWGRREGLGQPRRRFICFLETILWMYLKTKNLRLFGFRSRRRLNDFADGNIGREKWEMSKVEQN